MMNVCFSVPQSRPLKPWRNHVFMSCVYPLVKFKAHYNSLILIICVYLGDADGLGNTRKKELVKSCQTFGIQTNNVKSVNRPYVFDRSPPYF